MAQYNANIKKVYGGEFRTDYGTWRGPIIEVDIPYSDIDLDSIRFIKQPAFWCTVSITLWMDTDNNTYLIYAPSNNPIKFGDGNLYIVSEFQYRYAHFILASTTYGTINTYTGYHSENTVAIYFIKFIDNYIFPIVAAPDLTGIVSSADLTIPTASSLGLCSFKRSRFTNARAYDNINRVDIAQCLKDCYLGSSHPFDGADVILPQLEYPYMGETVRPNITVKIGSSVLTENVDYEYETFDASAPGLATVCVRGINQYAGGYVNVPFTIIEGTTDVSDSTVIISPNPAFYNGDFVTPSVSVELNGITLAEGVDYLKTYTNNRDIGTAFVTVAGIGQYTGSKTVNFEIIKRSITNATISVTPTSFEYDGQPKTPSVTVSIETRDLVEGVDYLKTYSNNIYPGTATVIVAAIETSEYVQGSASVPFTILAVGQTDPYSSGGTSTTYDSGNGTFDFRSDIIALEPSPTINVTDAGFCRIYVPTLAELKSLAQYMWTTDSFWETVANKFKQIFEDPLRAIISLNMLPCSVPTGQSEEVKVLFLPTGVNMSPATAQFVDVDCGTVSIDKVYDSALDYSPYTRVHCFLPYIGMVELDVDEIMGKTIQLKYRIDVATGMCVAIIESNADIIYQFSGHCAIAQPLSSADFSSYIGAAISAAKMIGGVAAVGAGVPSVGQALIGGPSYVPERTTVTYRDKTTDFNKSGTFGSVDWTRSGNTTTNEQDVTVNPARGITFGELTTRAVSNTVGSVLSSKVNVAHTGGFSGSSGYLGHRRPYLIFKRPNLANPEQYGKFNGRPCMITMQLGTCHGYTQVQSVQLTGIAATNAEMSEISELLKSGVIL